MRTDGGRATWARVEARGAATPGRRALHAGVAWRSQMLLFGGDDGERCRNDTWLCNVRERQWARVEAVGPDTGDESPHPRSGHAMCVVSGVPLLYGGSDTRRDSSHREFFDDLWALDSHGRWTPVLTEVVVEISEGESDDGAAATAVGPCGRRGASLVTVYQDCAMMFGGYGMSRWLDDVWFLVWSGPQTAGEWRQVVRREGEPWPPARVYHTAIPLPGCVLVLGGRAARPLQDAWLFDLGASAPPAAPAPLASTYLCAQRARAGRRWSQRVRSSAC